MQNAGAGIGIDHRLGAVVSGLLAADHDRQLALLGPGLSAGDRRIEEVDAGLFGLFGDLAGELGRGGRMVDQHRALPYARQHARRPVEHAAHVVVVADADKDEIRTLRRLGRRGAALTLVLGDPGLGARRRAVEDRHLMALGPQMPGHGIAHHAQTDECRLRHRPALSRFSFSTLLRRFDMS
jgi:hypothetical protein